MSAVDALILALADGRTMREAAAIARIPSAQAVRQARDVGWPDLDALRLAAEEIRDRHTTPPLSREETPVPPRKPEPIPIEADVEQAITAALIREARASVALDRDRDQTHVVDEIPDDLADVVDQQDQREHQAQPAPTVTGSYALDNTETVDDLDRIVDRTDDVEASVDPIDRVLMDDTAALLQTLERVTADVPDRPLGALDPEQRQRAVALREVADLILGGGQEATVGELLALTDYIITGTLPVLIVRGLAQHGERAS